MNDKNTIVEMQILATLLIVTNDQKLMVQGKLKQKAKEDLNIWISQGKKILKNMNLKGVNEEYYSIATDVIHDQLDEVRKAFKLMNNKSINI